MHCDAATRWLEPYLDGELDRTEARALEAHVDGCEHCQAALAELGRLRHAIRTEAPRYAAPDTLRARIRREGAKGAEPAPRQYGMPAWPRFAAACFAAFVAGAAVMRVFVPGEDPRGQVVHDLFASHWRALAAASPVDVVSSDRHTVKPWFAGKLAQSPRVVDFADQGFPLVGGRIDYAGTERVPVLVYRHDKHLIDVFVVTAAELPASGAIERREGYTLMVATLDGQSAAVVSDLDTTELARFRNLLDSTK